MVADSMESFCYLRNVQDLLADGKANGVSENHLKARLFRLVQWLVSIWFLQEDQSRFHQFGKNVVYQESSSDTH